MRVKGSPSGTESPSMFINIEPTVQLLQGTCDVQKIL